MLDYYKQLPLLYIYFNLIGQDTRCVKTKMLHFSPSM